MTARPLLPGDAAPAPRANDNASGVAVMLEAIRVLQETGYQPYKTLMFVAYSAEGLEGGELVLEPDLNRLLRARPRPDQPAAGGDRPTARRGRGDGGAARDRRRGQPAPGQAL